MTIHFETKRNGISVLLCSNTTKRLGMIMKGEEQENTFFPAGDPVMEDLIVDEISNKIARLNWLGL